MAKHLQTAASAKRYLSIGEMAQKVGVSIEVLRKWERDFPRVIRPMRTKGETRLYDHKQQEQVAMVYRLLHVEGMTIAGAQQRLRCGQSREEQTQEVLERLRGVRAQLMDVVHELEKVCEPQPAETGASERQ